MVANGSGANGGSNPALTTSTPSPRIGSPSLNKALPAPPPKTPPPSLLPPPSLQSSPASRPGTGGSGKNAHAPPPSGSHGKNKEKEKDMSHITPQPAAPGKRNAKLNILNPMSLLMRRRGQTNSTAESSRKAGARDLPEDFDPGIIYATRHPDWSSPGPKRPPVVLDGQPPRNARMLSPALAGLGLGEEHVDRQRTPVFKEHFGDNEATPTLAKTPVGITPNPPQHKANPEIVRSAPPEMRTPQMPPTPVTAILVSPAVSMGTTLVEKSPPVGTQAPSLAISSPGMLMPSKSNASTATSTSSSPSENDDGAFPRRKGVTLVDHPLSLPRHLMNNSSRFSFEASSAEIGRAHV